MLLNIDCMRDVLQYLVENLSVQYDAYPQVTVHKTGFTKQELWQLPCKGC